MPLDSGAIELLPRMAGLKGADLFRELPEELLARVAAVARPRTFYAGEALVREGAPAAALFVIGAGRASVRFGGAEKWQIGPPECVGEMALIDRGPSQATVVAIEETRALAISASDFEELLATQPAVVKALLRRLARRLREVAHAAFVERSAAMDRGE